MSRASQLGLGLGLVLSLGCSPATFDAFADAAPVQTEQVRFPNEPDAVIVWALTVPADDEGRGRVLVSDGDSALGWVRVDLDGRVDRRFASFTELLTINQTTELPLITGIGIIDDSGVAEGVVRIAASTLALDDDELLTIPARLVPFRVADFTRVRGVELDANVYPWVESSVGAPPVLGGPLASVQLDDGLPELLSASDAGVFVWDALGTEILSYADARGTALSVDPDAFTDDPSQGFGLTHCSALAPTALAGGRVLANDGPAALALRDETLTFIAPSSPPVLSAIGAPIYDCAHATLELPGPAEVLAVVDLGLDGDHDLLVGAPAMGAVWIYENLGDGLPSSPSMTLEAEAGAQEFGASLTTVELGGEAPEVIVVGAPGTAVGGEPGVGRVLIFDAADGALLHTIDDLEPRAQSRHGLAVHGLDVPAREELVVSGARELRVHWSLTSDDRGPVDGAGE